MKLKVGQKVRITQSDYLSLNGEGLVVGNTGTIRTLYPPSVYGVEVDNSTKPLSGDMEGWAFCDDELEALPSPLAVARAKGEAGALQAANNCGPEWMESALTCVRWFAKVKERASWKCDGSWAHSHDWTMEECRLWATAHDLPEAKSLRAWGAVTRRALSEGLIVPTGGYRATAASNGSVRALYRKS